MGSWGRSLPGVMLLGLLAVAGCSDNGTDPVAGGGGGATVSFAADVQPIFARRCLACHGVGGNAGLDLSPAVAWANLVGIETTNYAPRQRVMSANPDGSVLYLKLNGDASTGSRMPLGGALDPAMIELVRVWILEGALDN